MLTVADHPLAHPVLPAEAFRRAPLTTRDGRTLTIEDRFELAAMPSRFEWAFISGNAEALGDLLTDDVVIDHALGYAEGKAEMAKLSIPSFGLRHQMTNQLVFVDGSGDAALLSCLNAPQLVAEDATGASLPAIYANCVVVDAFRLGDDGLWRFSRRTFDQLKLADFLHTDPALAEVIAEPAAVRGHQPRPS